MVGRIAGVDKYAHINECIEQGDHGFVVNRFYDDGRRNQIGDDFWRGEPTTDSSSDQNSGEKEGSEEETASVFCGCERTGGEVGFIGARVEWDVLDIMRS